MSKRQVQIIITIMLVVSFISGHGLGKVQLMRDMLEINSFSRCLANDWSDHYE